MTARKKLSKTEAGDEDEPKPRQTIVVSAEPRKLPIKSKMHNATMRMFESYDPATHPQKVVEMAMNGATEREIRTALGISQPVFDMWRARHAAFSAALAIGPDAKLADARVQRSLFEMANGYEQPATKIMQIDGEIVAVDYVERVQKNPMAAKAWLANRDPHNWGRNPENATPLAPPSVLNLKMIQGMDMEQLRAVVGLLRQTLAPITAQSGLKRLDVVDAVAEEVKEPV